MVCLKEIVLYGRIHAPHLQGLDRIIVKKSLDSHSALQDSDLQVPLGSENHATPPGTCRKREPVMMLVMHQRNLLGCSCAIAAKTEILVEPKLDGITCLLRGALRLTLIPELGVPFSTILRSDGISAFQVSKDDRFSWRRQSAGACTVGKGVGHMKRSR